MARRSVAVRIADKEYRILSDADEEQLQRVASFVDDSMQRIRERTQTVDSLDVALLTALNLARQLLDLQDESEALGPQRLRALIDLAESAAGGAALESIP